MWIESDVPLGKGVSSSAALEVATLMALCQLYHIRLPDLELPMMAQRVENHIVGAPCGLMDQLSSYLGREGHLLPIQCQPAAVYDPVTIPDGVHFIGIDSGVRHAVSGDPYTDARVAAFMGYSMIARQAGATPEDLREAWRTQDYAGLPFGGYLANIAVPHFQESYEALLPDQLRGGEYLETYEHILDPVAKPQPEKVYRVRACASHPVLENDRIARFQHFMLHWAANDAKQTLLTMGDLMLASHAGYTACGLGSNRTDVLVNDLMALGPQRGIYGARVTGGGSGGTVCVLCYGDAGLEAVHVVAQAYARRYGYRPRLFTESGPGALEVAS